MPILSFEEFKDLKKHNNAILCLDLGQKRIGLALSDRSWNLASPYGLIEHKKFSNSLSQIISIYQENECGALIIGLPINMDDSEGAKCQSARQFGRNILKEYPEIPIFYQDERFTTIEAERILEYSDYSRDKKNQKIDKIAASFILQAFLDMAN